MSERSCGEQIPYLLKSYGVDTVFGMPGVHSLEFYRSLEEAGVASYWGAPRTRCWLHGRRVLPAPVVDPVWR